MMLFLIKCVFLFLAAAPCSSQNDDSQGQLSLEPIWRHALGGEVLSQPSFQAQSAVVALDGGNIRAYSNSGDPIWSFFAGGRISPYITRSREGTSYFSRSNGTLIALNRAGRELWRHSLDGPLCAEVITGWDSRLFVPTDKKIYCYTASGNLLWTKTLESSFLIMPKQDRSGGIIFALNNNEVYRLDHLGSAQVWKPRSAPAFLLPLENNTEILNNENSRSAQIQQGILILYTDGTMEILDNSVTLPKLPSVPAAAAIKENNIAVTLNDGRIAFVSVSEQKILWTGNTHMRETANSRDSLSEKTEVYFDERGIYVLNAAGASGFSYDGGRLWFMLLQNAAAVPAFGNDGVLYSGGKDWILYAYKIEERSLSNAIHSQMPESSYGLGRPRFLDTLDIPITENEIRARLDQINAALNSGKVGQNEPSWTSFLLTISAGEQSRIAPGTAPDRRNPVQIRIGALYLLGRLGSQDTIPWLVNIFRNETEPVVKAAAASAIGSIGVDSQGLAIQTFLYTVINSSAGNDQVLTAVAQATGAMCRFSGPPLSDAGIRILSLLCAGNQPSVVRRQAERELAALR